MRKGFSKLFIIFMTLGIFLSNVAAVPTQNKSVILTDVRYVNGVGIVLLFDTTGLTKKDLRGEPHLSTRVRTICLAASKTIHRLFAVLFPAD